MSMEQIRKWAPYAVAGAAVIAVGGAAWLYLTNDHDEPHLLPYPASNARAAPTTIKAALPKDDRIHRPEYANAVRLAATLKKLAADKTVVVLHYSSISSPATVVRAIEAAEQGFVQVLDLAYNKLTSLAGVESFSNTNSLIVRFNLLEDLSGVEKLVQLVRLDGRHNKIRSLPTSIASLANLQELLLSFNTINRLPDDLGSLQHLKKLDLSMNFVQLPASIGNLANLEELYLRQNNLNALPASIVNLKKLRALDVRANRLADTTIALIGQIESLQVLDLTSCAYLGGQNGSALAELTNLKDLRIGNNGLLTWPLWISKMANLEKLDLASNSVMEGVPEYEQLSGLVKLERINLLRTKIEGIPPQLLKLPSIKFIALATTAFDEEWPESRLHPDYALPLLKQRLLETSSPKPDKSTIAALAKDRRPYQHLSGISTPAEQAKVLQIFQEFLDLSPGVNPPTSTTTLSREALLDKILGCLFGNAIGDAVGLATEFLSKDVSQFYCSAPIEYSNFFRCGHRIRWEEGDWTDDTDQMVLILEELVKSGTAPPDFRRYGESILKWAHYGFSEVGDEGGSGLGAHTKKVMDHAAFLTNPITASEKVWLESQKQSAANGAVMRTSVTGVWNFWNKAIVEKNTDGFAKVTHFDPRCVGSARVVALTIRSILTGELDPTNSSQVSKFLAAQARQVCETVKVDPQHQTAFINSAAGNLSLFELELDEPRAIGYTLKTLGAGIWALKSDFSFEEALTALTFEAGDADTNGAVAGALLGAKYGFRAIPARWVTQLCHLDWFVEKARTLVQAMGI